MAQIFRRSSNTIVKVGIIAAIPVLLLFWWVSAHINRSYGQRVNFSIAQPVPFSHQHHVSGLGIDCRYCHTTVEKAASAGIPPIHTCMTCHSQIWTGSEMLEPIRKAWKSGKPVQWSRVYDVPDFVYFHHGIHVQKGVGCSTCHGRVDQMPITRKANAMFMDWCLGCHREPWKHLRPEGQVFNMDWKPPANQDVQGKEFVEERKVRVEQLLDCWICHR